MPNRLAHETSPYLLQHKDNPVDWYPWGKEAIERAKAENKPILLSVGYSACHWCHVMEHESFENPEIAQVMNQKFINIKVDREERPDLDHIYQNVVQAISMGGGWPLTVFLTPELKPFFGGTYFPPEDRWGRPGFPRVLTALSEAYLSDQESVTRNIESLMDYLSHMERIPSLGSATPTQERLSQIAQEVLQVMDLTKGGLSGAPKFPNSMLLTFLWREGISQGVSKAQEAALLSLEKMASGGIYDQLGGGFHRYSVDDSWSVPHFEKMLYDNGLLLKLYSEVLLKDGKPPFAVDPVRKELFLRVIEETTQYVLSEMTSPEGGFFSAQDADTEGEEGKFFAWESAEVERELEPQEAKSFTLRYGVSAEGNFEHGKNVLHLALSIAEVAAKIGESEEQVRALLESARAKLKRERDRRVKPATDHKVIASWNGLMISGLAWASQALRAAGRGESARKAWEGATRAFEFVKKNHAQSPSDGRDSGARLWSTGKLNGYLDDYAFMAMAALDLARFEEGERSIRDRMGIAEKWCESVIAHFSDPESAGYYFTSDDHEALIQRPKTLFDQAIPAGTSVAIHCMMALSEMGSVDAIGKFSKEVEKQLPELFPLASRSAQGCAELLNGASIWLQGPRVLSGPDTARLVTDPAVFRKASDPGAEGKRLICHRGGCQAI